MAIKDDMEDVQEAVINELITENGITNTLADGQVTPAKLSAGGPSWDANGVHAFPSMCNFYSNTTIVGTAGFVATGFYLQGEANHSGIRFGGGQLVPFSNGADADNSIDLGASSVRFDDIYATNGSIQTSDQNEKQDIESLSEAEQRVAVAAKGLLRKFRWKSAVEEKSDEARIHFGIIAQDLQAAFEAEGLDAGRYAMFISTTWTDEETGEEKTRLGVRYSELLAFIISAI
jgi:hypothetical protein